MKSDVSVCPGVGRDVHFYWRVIYDQVISGFNVNREDHVYTCIHRYTHPLELHHVDVL